MAIRVTDMLRNSIVASLALVVAACGGSDGDGFSAGKAAMEQTAPTMAMAPPPPPPAPAAMDAFASRAESAVGGTVSFDSPGQQAIIQQDQQGGGGGGQPVQLIAYTYNYGFKVPPAKMEGLLTAHKAACERAGPQKCYVVNSSISGIGQESSYGQLTVRGAPDWVKTFQTGMADSLKPFDADLDSNNDSAEDLTVQIVDSEARLKSMKTMRDRLQELLRDRPGRLSDLLEIEREFARVQADIDSHESVLAALKLRVAMSVMTLNYQPKYGAVSESIWRPLGDAFGNFVPNMASTLAGIVEFISAVLPVVIVGGVIIWGLMALWGWRRKKRKAKPGPLTPRAAGSGGPGGP